MTELPKNFPEYSIMYKTLDKKIKELKNKKLQTKEGSTLEKIQSDIDQYQKEMDKIKTIFPENFFDHSIHLHHDHDTGMTIGAVHAHCNAVLWEYEGV